MLCGKTLLTDFGVHKMAASDNKILLIILAIFLLPIAVLLKSGVGKDLLINIILCLLFFLPGLIHALWVVTK
jgi:uncharacterized membrane protein YqaE (UPF0057 family)